MTIEGVRQYKFDPKEVIEGLNGYYESNKRNGYITIRRNDVEGPAYCTAALYLSALIEWLRVDHDIFYYPGMDIRDSVESGLTLDQVEAARNAAKMCCLRAHIKDEISKRGIWCTAEEDIPELVDALFRALDECSKARDRNRKDATKLSEVTRELRKELNALKDTVSQVRARLNSKFVPLPGYEEDLVKLADIALRAVEARDETINRLTRTWDQELKNSQKTDINKLIRDCCLRHNIVAPSRYLSDEACVEYVFSLLDSYSKQRNEACADRDRAATILQNLYRDIFKKQPDGLSAEDIANKILDKVLKTEDLDIREKTRNEVFYYIIGTYQKHGLDPSDIYSPNNSLEDVIYRLIVRYEAKVKLCNQLKQEGVDRNEVIKRLKQLLNEINKEEDEE